LVFHDLTRLRQLEAVRQEFVANVSHELRTPLSPDQERGRDLARRWQGRRRRACPFSPIIDKHANRLTLLIDDLLMLSTLDSGTMRLYLQPVSLRTAVQEVIDDLKGRASVRGVQLNNAIPTGLIAQAGPDRLRQVLSNLWTNSIKNWPPRRAGRGERAGRGTASRSITVQDDGPGIPPEACARIFERFFRGDKALLA